MMPRSSYTDVQPGTAKHAIVQKLMQPEGCTSEWAQRQCGIKNTAFGSILKLIPDFHGYDIRAFPNKPNGNPGPTPLTYRIVGRYQWDGGYESYINPDDYVDDKGVAA